MTGTGSATPLVCPACGSAFPEDERFCPDCKLPLTLERPPGGQGPVSDRHAWARKIKPQLAEGSLVRVAGARNQAEAEFIQGMLLEEGVPSLLRRSAGGRAAGGALPTACAVGSRVCTRLGAVAGLPRAERRQGAGGAARAP